MLENISPSDECGRILGHGRSLFEVSCDDILAINDNRDHLPHKDLDAIMEFFWSSINLFPMAAHISSANHRQGNGCFLVLHHI